MPKLIRAADAAVPFDYTRLDPKVRVVLGYVGISGCTPHVWTTAEVRAVRNSGLLWCPIVVPVQRALTTADGDAAASAMIAALPQYDYPRGGPVFIDIERGSYDADPAGAHDAVGRWRARMAAAGWPDAFAYWPADTAYTWLPKWVKITPRSLPGKAIGQQWRGNADGGRYDLSVFDPAVFAALTQDGGNDVGDLSKDSQQFIVDQLGKVQQNLADMINALHVGKGGGHEWAANMSAVQKAVKALEPATGGAGLTDAQVTALSATLAADLSKSLPQAVVKALAAALAS